MTRQELLTYAAIAAGHTIQFYWQGNEAGEAPAYRENLCAEILWEKSPTDWGWSNWEPLECGIDAMRLAVKLRLSILLYKNTATVEYPKTGAPTACLGLTGITMPMYGKDDDAVVRRLIVEVAARIGKAMSQANELAKIQANADKLTKEEARLDALMSPVQHKTV